MPRHAASLRSMSLKSAALKSAPAALALALIVLDPLPAPAKAPAAHLSAALLGDYTTGTVLDRAGTYDGGSRRCGWVRRYDAYGNYTGKVRNCS